jgi:hypothetical protein
MLFSLLLPVQDLVHSDFMETPYMPAITSKTRVYMSIIKCLFCDCYKATYK